MLNLIINYITSLNISISDFWNKNCKISKNIKNLNYEAL